MDTRRLSMMWWSGALGLLAVVHLGRAITSVPVVIGHVDVPIWVSAAVGLVTAVGASWLWWAAEEPVRLARLRQTRHIEEPKRPDKQEAREEHRAEAGCGLHDVVATDKNDAVVDKKG